MDSSIASLGRQLEAQDPLLGTLITQIPGFERGKEKTPKLF